MVHHNPPGNMPPGGLAQNFLVEEYNAIRNWVISLTPAPELSINTDITNLVVSNNLQLNVNCEIGLNLHLSVST